MDIYLQNNKIGHISHHIQKSIQNGVNLRLKEKKDLRPKALKLLERNKDKNLGNNFLAMTPKAQTVKNKQVSLY